MYNYTNLIITHITIKLYDIICIICIIIHIILVITQCDIIIIIHIILYKLIIHNSYV